MSDVQAESFPVRRSAWLIWIAVAVVMSALSWSGDTHSVTQAYRTACLNWFAGEPLYNLQGSGFIYLPQSALVFAPWGLLPVRSGEVVWRCTILAVFAAGVLRLTRLVSSDDRWFLVNTIVSVATAVGCVRNGQATLMIAGLMMLACADLHERRWPRASTLLVLAFAFKPTSLILALLAGALFPPMLWRLAAGGLVVAVLPFATQDSAYVVSQFAACYQNSRIAFHVGETGYWAQLFGIFKVAGFDIPLPIQEGASALAGLVTLVACWLATRKLESSRGIHYLYSISTCYLMLFNSRTEGSTYAMVAPVYGILLASALANGKRAEATWMIVASLSTVLNYELVHLFTRQRHAEVWVCPFICLIVTTGLINTLAFELVESRKTQALSRTVLPGPWNHSTSAPEKKSA